MTEHKFSLRIPLVPEPSRILSSEGSRSYTPQEIAQKVIDTGLSPTDFLMHKIVGGVRVISIGEKHSEMPHIYTLLSLVDNIQKRHNEIGDIPSIGTVALELHPHFQPGIDKYLETGEMGEFLSVWDHAIAQPTAKEKFVEVLKKIRELNANTDGNGNIIKITCIDLPAESLLNVLQEETQREDDAYIHQKLWELVAAESDKITIFYGGDAHVSHATIRRGRRKRRREVLPYGKLGNLLGPQRYIAIGQFDLPELPQEMPSGGTMVSTADDPRLQVTRDQISSERFGDYDAIVFRPREPLTLGEKIVSRIHRA